MVPPTGCPQPTLAVAFTVVFVIPSAGAKTSLLTVDADTVTRLGLELKVGTATLATLPVRLAATRLCAVTCGVPHAPVAQSCATAKAAASTPFCNRCFFA